MSPAVAHEFSPDDCYRLATFGGNWLVARALDIANGVHAAHLLAAGTRSLQIIIQSTPDVLVRFDVSASDTISAANDLILRGWVSYRLTVPHNLGVRPYVHFKQVSPALQGSVRMVER